MRRELATALLEGAVGHKQVEVTVEAQVTAESLDDRDDPAVERRDGGESGAFITASSGLSPRAAQVRCRCCRGGVAFALRGRFGAAKSSGAGRPFAVKSAAIVAATCSFGRRRTWMR